MKKVMILISVVALLIVMAISNPNKTEYINWLKTQVVEQNNDDMLLQGIVALAGEPIINSATKIHNYVFLSVYHTNLSDIGEINVIGVFGNFISLSNQNSKRYSVPSKSSIAEKDFNSTSSSNANNNQSLPEETLDSSDEVVTYPSDDKEYSVYTNQRFGFSIEYPKEFVVEETAQNGDGAKIINNNDETEILVYGSNNTSNETTKSACAKTVDRISSKIEYKFMSDNWYVLSWIEDGKIKYLKEFVGSGSTNTFIITYDQKFKDKYNKIVEVISKNFIAPEIASSR